MKTTITLISLTLGIIGIIIGGMYKFMADNFDKKESLLKEQNIVQQKKHELEMESYKKANEALRHTITSLDDGIAYNLDGEMVIQKAEDLIISRNDAKDLIKTGRFMAIDDFLIYDYEKNGYEFFEGRLFQIIELMKNEEYHFSEDDPDDEDDPLWWIEAWSFHNQNSGNENIDFEDNFSHSSLFRIRKEIFDKAEPLLKEKYKLTSTKYNKIPNLLKVLILIMVAYEDHDIKYNNIQYNQDIGFIEGILKYSKDGKEKSHKFKMLGIQNTGNVFILMSSYSSDLEIMNPILDEASGFVSGFRLIRD